MSDINQRFIRMASALNLIVILLFATVAAAQQTAAPTSTLADKALPIPTTEEMIKKDPKIAVETAAEVLGLIRGVQRSKTAVNTVEFAGTGTVADRAPDGTWRNYTLTRFTAAFDFVIPAARFDMERSAPGVRPQRHIEVVSGKQAWDEEKPGIDGTPIAGAAGDRARLIWLTPHGAMRGALMADDVRIASEGGKVVITYSVNAEPVKVVLNAGLLPERVQIQAHGGMFADTTLEATYSRYKDFEGYLFQCPSRMTQKAGSRTILDVTVSNCVVNPYVIFPPPANLAKANASK
jgi:hypothetical protein